MIDYLTNRAIHNAFRWLILAAGVWALQRAASGLRSGRAWTGTDRLAGLLFTTLLNLQFMIGLALWLRSPLVRPAFDSLEYLASAPSAAFFVLVHPLAMTTAVVAAQAGHSLAIRAEDDRSRFRRATIGHAVALVVLALAIPWPFLPYGRSLVPGGG